MTDLIWPDRPTCHDKDSRATAYRGHPVVGGTYGSWRSPRPFQPGGGTQMGDEGNPLRTCWYCGSITAEDFYEILLREEKESTDSTMDIGGRPFPLKAIEMADWKYGYPHKLYIRIPNPDAGRPVILGSTSDRHGTTLHPPHPAGDQLTVKFYTEHLYDLDADVFNAVAMHIGNAIDWQPHREAGGMIWQKVSVQG